MRFVIAVLLLSTCFAQEKKPTPAPAPAPSAPALTAEQREAVRKFQLTDARYENAIKQRQLEINSLQGLQGQNLRSLNDYVGKLCKPPEWVLDGANDELKCVAAPKPVEEKKEEKKK